MGAIVDFAARVERAEAKLEKCSITEKNKDLITHFCEYKTAQKVKLPRIDKYLMTLRLVAERYLNDRDFTALTSDDIITIIAKVERSGLSDWTKHDYNLILKTFYKWLNRDDIVKVIKVVNPGNKTLPEDLLTEEDVQKMIDAAYTQKDKAFVACLYEGGFRIGEIGGLAVKDVTFDKYGAIVIVNGKTGMRRVRLIFAMPYLAAWLEAHPFRSEPDAPLWLNMGVGAKGRGMKYEALRLQIRRIGERAGVQAKINPHNFRHSRATFLASRLKECQLNEYLGLVQGSNMTRVYVHLSGRDLDSDLLKMYGLKTDEEQEQSLKTVKCPHCETYNTEGARVCVKCKMPLTVAEVAAKEDRLMEFFSDLMDLAGKSSELSEMLQKIIGPKEL